MSKEQMTSAIRDPDSVIQIILADDHALVTEGLRTLIDQQPDMYVTAVVEDGKGVLDLLRTCADLDVVVLDLQMPYSGFDVLKAMRQINHRVRILVLTAFADGESIKSALELGADGFALKTESPTQTIEAIRQVAQGRLVFPRAARRWMAGAEEDVVKARTTPLSPREKEVLMQLTRGLPNAEIATALSVSENTIRFHLKNIYEKLHVANRTEATAWWFQQQKP